MNPETETAAGAAAETPAAAAEPKAEAKPKSRKSEAKKAAADRGKKAKADKAPAKKPKADKAPAKKAPAKKAPAKKAPAKKAAPKAEGGRRGRVSQFAGMKIQKLVKGNPRREGTAGHASFALITNGMRYEKFIELGGRSGDLAFDVQRGHLKMVK